MTSKADRVSGLYVWTLCRDEPVIVGRFEHYDKMGTFYYANSYVARPDAYPIDPINLPLIAERDFHTQANGGYFGVILDAGPDSWGQQVLASLSRSKPRNPLEFLLAGNGDGCGSLLFSLSRGNIKKPGLRGNGTDVAILEKAAHDLLEDESLSPDVKEALLARSSLGGARPKATVTVDGVPYLAKFAKKTDTYNEVRAEKASLDMAEAAGIVVPQRQLITVCEGRDVLLLRRFDYDEEGLKQHYISANAILNLHRVQEGNPAYGYPGLAELIRRFAGQPTESCEELFRRMAFRVLIGDTDDHGRNYGFLRVNAQYQHTPMFDVLPHLSSNEYQGMPIGRDGRERTLKNLLSMPEAFGLKRAEAVEIVREQAAVVRQWRDFFHSSGVSDRDMDVLEPCFRLVGSDNDLHLTH